jgi:ABC-type nitrate/sulfonate/bicarbonate transport system permease component
MNSSALKGLGGVVFFLLAWELFIDSAVIHFEYLPPPSKICIAWLSLVQQQKYWLEISHTLFAAVLGWLIASFIGIVLGAALAISKRFRQFSLTTIEVLRPLPGVAFAPVGLLLFGFSLNMELTVICLPTLWPILMNTMAGILNLSKKLEEVVNILHLTPTEAMRKIYFPAAATSVLVGLRISLSLAVVMAVVAEMIGNPEGLGYAIVREQQAMNPNDMFAYIFTVGCIGICINYLLSQLAIYILPGQFLRKDIAQTI